jgi:Sulfotransferase family
MTPERSGASVAAEDLRSAANHGQRKPPVFIVGCERSGTTLLRLMLDSHPELAIPPESLFIPRAWEVRGRYARKDGFDWRRMIDDIFMSLRVQEWRLPKETVHMRLDSQAYVDFASVIRALFEAFAESRGKERWGDKTPSYLLALPLLSQLFEESRIIHIIRDGRAVAFSLWKAPFGPSSLGRAAERWAHQVPKGRLLGQQLKSECYREIRYETLVAQPRDVLEELCDFLDLEFVPEMLSYSSSWQSAVPERVHGHHSNLALPPAPLGDWRKKLTSSEIALVEMIQQGALDEFGYQRIHRDVPASVRLRSLGVRASVLCRRAYFSVERNAHVILHRKGLPRPRAW